MVRNISRRVPAAEAAQLREDIDNAKLYEELTGELARINIECTLQLRSAKDGSGESAESKKTPVRNVCGTLRRNRSLYRESQSEPKPYPCSRALKMSRFFMQRRVGFLLHYS